MDSPAPVILIATTNQGKLREVRQVLAGVGVVLRSLAEAKTARVSLCRESPSFAIDLEQETQ